MPKKDKAAQIMSAAEKLFTSRRFHEITVEDIARKAGVGKGTVYRYFKDKDDVFEQVVMSGFDALCDVVRRGARGSGDFEARLLGVCTKISQFFRERRQLFHMMQSEERRALSRRGKMREDWLERRRQLISAVAEILARGRSEGVIREGIALELLAAFLLGLLRTRARQANVFPELEEAGHETVVDFFCYGAGVRLPEVGAGAAGATDHGGIGL